MNRQISFTAPYPPYDDTFSVDQNIHKVLFRPGQNIDQTHLNLLQSILQEQISRFGEHIFTNGSYVTGGQYNQVVEATVLDIVDLRSSDIQHLKQFGAGNWLIEDSNTVISILSIDSEKENTPEVHKLLVSKDTPLSLVSEKHYTIHHIDFPELKLTVRQGTETMYLAFDEGVMFVNGYFISVPKQYTIIRYASCSVGFLLDQNIISYFDDASLLDNSIKDFGSTEGSDRLKLQLELASFSLAKQQRGYNIARGSFFEFLRLDNWEVVTDLTKTQYSKTFSQMLARRTVDKSGSYTVSPFRISIKEDNDINFKIEIGAGKAYIFGYEFDSLAKQTISLPRNSTQLIDQSNTLSIPNLSYLICPTLDRFIPLHTDVDIHLYDADDVQIGSGTIGYIKQVDSKIRLCLSSFLFDTNKSFSDLHYVTDSSEQLLASVESYLLVSSPSRIITLDPDEKISSVSKIEDLVIQRVFESVVNNQITFLTNETPPSELTHYIAFNKDQEVVIVDDLAIEDKIVTLLSQDSIEYAIVSGVKRSVIHESSVDRTITVQVPFSTSIDFPYQINSVVSATNNQENITAYFTVSKRSTDTRVLGSTLTYARSDSRTGNLLLTLDTTTYYENTVRLDNTTLDFRQSSYFSYPLVEPNSPVKLSYTVSQARFDKLVLTKEGNFELISGTPHPYKPLVPKDRIDAMTLYILYIPGNVKSAEDIGIKFVENKRYTMRDIGKLEKRIENLEYYNLLSLLEKETADQNYKDENGLNRFKNGFMVDNFKTYKGVDFRSTDCLFSFDLQQGHLRPPFEMHTSALEVSTPYIPILSCPYTEVALIDQNQASSTMNLNPYEVFVWEGKVTLDPAIDYWMDTTVKPDINLDHKGEFDIYASFKEKGFTSEWGVWDTKILNLTSTDLKNVETQEFADVDLPKEKRLWIPGIDPSASSDLVAKYNLWVSSGYTRGFSKTSPDGFVDGKPAVLLDFKGQKLQKSTDLVHFGDSKILNNSLGTTVRDVVFSPYIRERDIQFKAVGLKPNTTFFVTFSDIDVTELCSGDLTSDDSGFLGGFSTYLKVDLKMGNTNLNW